MGKLRLSSTSGRRSCSRALLGIGCEEKEEWEGEKSLRRTLGIFSGHFDALEVGRLKGGSYRFASVLAG